MTTDTGTKQCTEVILSTKNGNFFLYFHSKMTYELYDLDLQAGVTSVQQIIEQAGLIFPDVMM